MVIDNKVTDEVMSKVVSEIKNIMKKMWVTLEPGDNPLSVITALETLHIICKKQLEKDIPKDLGGSSETLIHQSKMLAENLAEKLKDHIGFIKTDINEPEQELEKADEEKLTGMVNTSKLVH